MLSAQRVRHSQVYLLYPSGAVSSSSAPLAEVLAAPAGLQTGGSGPDTLIDLMVHESARHSCVRSRRQHAEGSRRLWRQHVPLRPFSQKLQIYAVCWQRACRQSLCSGGWIPRYSDATAVHRGPISSGVCAVLVHMCLVAMRASQPESFWSHRSHAT